MNSYPRKILDGRTPFEALQEEMNFLGASPEVS